MTSQCSKRVRILSTHNIGMMPSLLKLLLLAATLTTALAQKSIAECDPEMIVYEVVSGFDFSAAVEQLDVVKGTLMLTDCLEICHQNETCLSVKFETGLCVLFSSNVDAYPGALTKSQFPVFTMYAQKNCLAVKPCDRPWVFDRVLNHTLLGYSMKNQTVSSRIECLELCLGEEEFNCRSANYNNSTNNCDMSEMDRRTVAGMRAFKFAEQVDYLESNCANEPGRLCEFKKLANRILKTVDSVYQDVPSVDECRELCLNSPFRCRSYDFGDTGENVCRVSHHSRPSLSDLQQPYLDVPESATYELSACYNVSVECQGGVLSANISTSKMFNGKIYAKGSPTNCMQDVTHAMEFSLQMPFDDPDCNVTQLGVGHFGGDIVVQHHDMVITSSDVRIAVSCEYDLSNITVGSEIYLGVKGDARPALMHTIVVTTPNVTMRITDQLVDEPKPNASVGDALALRFSVQDENNPYDLFVRDLVVMDDEESSEIVLIDSDGCPTNHYIMGPVLRNVETGKGLVANFEAFRFPTSEVVHFRASVTPCMPECEPAHCESEDSSGEVRSVMSYGRRRRRDVTKARRKRKAGIFEDVLLAKSIHIGDKLRFFSADKFGEEKPVFMRFGGSFTNSFARTFATAGALFLLAHLALKAVFAFKLTGKRHRQRRRPCKHHM